MTRPIDADALHVLFDEKCIGECESCTYYEDCKGHRYCGLIDLAPTIPLPDFKEGYKQAIRDRKTNFSRHEEEIALNIACDLLNGATLYGYDFERIFDEIMEHEGCVSSHLIKEYILDHIEELGKEYFSRERARQTMTDKALRRLVETLVDKGIFSKEDEEYVLDALEEENQDDNKV